MQVSVCFFFVFGFRMVAFFFRALTETLVCYFMTLFNVLPVSYSRKVIERNGILVVHLKMYSTVSSRRCCKYIIKVSFLRYIINKKYLQTVKYEIYSRSYTLKFVVLQVEIPHRDNGLHSMVNKLIQSSELSCGSLYIHM